MQHRLALTRKRRPVILRNLCCAWIWLCLGTVGLGPSYAQTTIDPSITGDWLYEDGRGIFTISDDGAMLRQMDDDVGGKYAITPMTNGAVKLVSERDDSTSYLIPSVNSRAFVWTPAEDESVSLKRLVAIPNSLLGKWEVPSVRNQQSSWIEFAADGSYTTSDGDDVSTGRFLVYEQSEADVGLILITRNNYEGTAHLLVRLPGHDGYLMKAVHDAHTRLLHRGSPPFGISVPGND